MLRIKDPTRSLGFYVGVLGMTMLDRFDFPEGRFSLYFLGYPAGPAPEARGERITWLFEQPALLELTHNWETESATDFQHHNGNSEPRGFGHIGLSVPDVAAACAAFERHGVAFVKRPNEGSMTGIAFITDPDGYWIEILSGNALRNLLEFRST